MSTATQAYKDRLARHERERAKLAERLVDRAPVPHGPGYLDDFGLPHLSEDIAPMTDTPPSIRERLARRLCEEWDGHWALDGQAYVETIDVIFAELDAMGIDLVERIPVEGKVNERDVKA